MSVSGFGFRVSSFGFRVSSPGFRVSSLEFRVWGFKFRVSSFGLSVSCSGVCVHGVACRVAEICLGSRFYGPGFNVFYYIISLLGFRV